MTDHVVEAAAANAGWCDAVCRSLGGRTAWAADAWTAADRAPTGYPDAVTLVPGTDALAVLSRVDARTGCSVKDSFADLELASLGFRVLFHATWIRRAAMDVPTAPVLNWQEVRTPADLRQWSQGHDLDVFVPELLEVEDLRFFQAGLGQTGFALHRWGDVVSVSNTFAAGVGQSTVWSDVVAIAGQAFPGRELVGYEQGADLDAALTVGFEETAPLRVWIR
jgi:hypothetical protein